MNFIINNYFLILNLITIILIVFVFYKLYFNMNTINFKRNYLFSFLMLNVFLFIKNLLYLILTDKNNNIYSYSKTVVYIYIGFILIITIFIVIEKFIIFLINIFYKNKLKNITKKYNLKIVFILKDEIHLKVIYEGDYFNFNNIQIRNELTNDFIKYQYNLIHCDLKTIKIKKIKKGVLK